MKYIILVVLTFALAACAGRDGKDGEPGVAGAVGARGPEGQAGQSGPAGQDGTAVVPVKFCSGQATYPSKFPEYGLCINGQLFAVYSANDGFLTLIPNGSYQSNAIGSSCSFVVNGCTISH